MQSPFFGACGSVFSEATTTLIVLDDINHQSKVSTRLYYSTDSNFQKWAVAYPIQVRKGGAPITPASNTLITSTTSGIIPWASTSVSSNSPGRLSTGAIVGIAFGGFFSIAVVALGIFWLLRWRGNNPAQPTTPQAEETGKNVVDGQVLTPGDFPNQICQEMVSASLVPEKPGSPN
ncbi:hypothetical protein GQ44DRAFT_714539 [Phaeosphaeriaceae sp. PMI808]|nr:hypothetical protein GQ44DRAFT_714539 [Phaeosphaeriaceae sp. PMI808]